MTRYFDICEPDEHLEGWETVESRASSEMWRGEASSVAARDRSLPNALSDAQVVDLQNIRTLIRLALNQNAAIFAVFANWQLHQKEVELSSLRQKLAGLLGRRSIPSSFASPPWLHAALTELADLQREASRLDWDHAGALPVASATVGYSQALLGQLAEDCPQPEIGAGRCGQITLDWLGPSDSCSLTVEVWPDRKLVYSALFNDDVFHGTETNRDTLPSTIELVLARLLENPDGAATRKRD